MKKSIILIISIICLIAIARGITTINDSSIIINGVAVCLFDGTNCREETGWADYIDTQYNTSNRFTASNGVLANFPNNMGSIRAAQIPSYINESGGFYNGTHILGRNGDAYGIGIRFKAEPQGANTYCQFFYNISGAVGQLPARLLTFPKGSGVEHDLKFFAEEYTLDTWEANGARLEVLCSGADVEFWGISYEIFVAHKAR